MDPHRRRWPWPRRSRQRVEPSAGPSRAEARRLGSVEKQVERLTAAVERLGSDVEASATRASQTAADAARRVGSAERGLVDAAVRQAAAETRTAASLADVRRVLTNAIAEQQRSLAADLERRAQRASDQLAEARAGFEAVLAGAEARHAHALEAAVAEQGSRLAVLTAAQTDVATRLEETERDLGAWLDKIARDTRDRFEAGTDEQADLARRLQETGRDLAARLAAAEATVHTLSRAQALADEQAATRLREQMQRMSDALDGPRRELERRAAAAEDAAAAASGAVAAANARIEAVEAGHGELHHLHATVFEALHESAAAVERLDGRLTGGDQRIEEVMLRTTRVAAIGTALDELQGRVAAAEVLLEQRKDTNYEEYLDRVEAFERLASETDPDSFAGRAELDGLRQRLDEIDRALRDRDLLSGR